MNLLWSSSMIRVSRGTSVFSLLMAFLALSPISTPAKPWRDLPVEWKGTATITSFGVHSKLHPLHGVGSEKATKPSGWNAYEEGRTLKIVRQQGRHVEFVIITPRGTSALFVGTFSGDGKQLIAADGFRTLMFTREGNRLSGCGTVRGGEGDFENYRNNYAAICLDLTAAK